jgi:CHAD domain-containing protein
MAFRLRPGESVARGLRRVARKQLLSARNELRKASPPRDEAIHEARKSIKKVRAVMDLVAADDGRGLAGCWKSMRKVNRTLSDLRDADAMLAILTKLRNKEPRAFDEHGFARVRRLLTSHKQTLMKAAQHDAVWKDVDRELDKLRKKAKRWRPTHSHFGALAAGIRISYRRGRKALARARKRQAAADFHEWRKCMKDLWYQLRLVEGCSSGIGKDVRVLHQAETFLGDDHNLVVLCAELSEDASLCDVALVRPAADRYQAELRRRAIASAAGIYRSRPAKYVRRIKDAWTAWHRHDRVRHTRSQPAAA